MTNEELYYLPASELLKHIQAEKERLVNEKIIKKSKPLPPITEEEKPYDLPAGWEWVRLGEFTNFINGDRGKNYPSKSEFIESGVPFINAGHIDNGEIYLNKMNYISEEKFKTLGSGKIQPLDILYCIRGTLGKIGRVVELNKGAIASSLVIIRPILPDLHNYIFHYLISPLGKSQIKLYDNGSAQPNLSADNVKQFIIPLPPLYIQDQIVQKLEQLSKTKDSLLSHAESQLNYTKKMREALLQEAIRGELVPQDENDEPASVLLEKIKTEKERLIKEKVIKKQKELPPITDEEKPYGLPVNWEWVRLGEYFDVIMGSSPKGNTVGDDLDGIEFHQGKVYFTDKFLKKSTQKTTQPTKLAIPNDVLLSVRAPVGTVNITEREICIGRGLCAIRPYLSDIPYQFVYYILSALKEEFIKQATGTTFIAITADVIRNQLIPLPPLAEQERIVEKLDELMANCDQLEVKAEEMKKYTAKLFEASLKEAFVSYEFLISTNLDLK